jgi:hypothetical protein
MAPGDYRDTALSQWISAIMTTRFLCPPIIRYLLHRIQKATRNEKAGSAWKAKGDETDNEERDRGNKSIDNFVVRYL